MRQPWTPDRKRVAVELYRTHQSTEIVAAMMHTNRRYVRQALQEVGAPRRPEGALPMERNHRWKGGRIVDSDGYVLLKAPDHPDSNHLGYVREHRLVMEQKIGRRLSRSEVVHHLNSNKQDNRPENLDLYPTNGAHLAAELAGRTPKWSEDGRARLLAFAERRRLRSPPSTRSPSRTGAPESP
jgi:hypothetical protein